MILGHYIQLDPTVKQSQYFERACGTSRLTWNWALSRWNELYAEGKKPNASDLKKEFNAIKYEKFPWLVEIHRDAHSQPFANLQRAFGSFFKKTAKHPTFKKKGKSRDSFYVSNDRFNIGGSVVRLPVVGTVKMKEQLRFDGKIMSATVSREANRWFISIAVDVKHLIPSIPLGNPVGIDVGITTFATLSTGKKIESPRPLRTAEKQLCRVSRQHSRKKKGSRNSCKSVMRLAKIHRRVKNIRKDFLHKLSTRLTKTHSQIGIENLNVKGMLQNHCLARAISDAGWSEFRRQLEYKSGLYGANIVVHDRFFPSSKTCSNCGIVSKKMSLSVRIWVCPDCGAQHDRDVNAAKNLKPTTDGLSGSHACGERDSAARRNRNYTVANSRSFTP